MSEYLELYRSSPKAFRDALLFPTADGPQPFGAIAADFQVEGFRALDPDLLALRDGTKPPHGRHWTERSKGGSKDSDTSMSLLWLLLFSQRALTIRVGAGDFAQADELRRAALSIVRMNPWIAQYGIEIQRDAIKNVDTGSIAQILTMDPSGSHGARPDWTVINELSHLGSREFCLTLLDDSTKNPLGVVSILTNAGFIDSWQHELRELYRTDPRWKFSKYCKPAPWLSPQDIEEARRRNPDGRFRRLFLGEWVHGSEGDGIPYNLIERACILDGPHPLPLKSTHFYAGAVDLGVRKDNASFVLFGVCPSMRRIEVARVENWSPQMFGGAIDLPSVERRILELSNEFQSYWTLFDRHQGELMISRLRAAGINCLIWDSSPRSQHEMAVTLLESFQNETLALYKDELLISDLTKARIVERPSVGYKIEWPRDEHGHCDRGQCVASALPLLQSELRGLIRDMETPSAGYELTQAVIV